MEGFVSKWPEAIFFVWGSEAFAQAKSYFESRTKDPTQQLQLMTKQVPQIAGLALVSTTLGGAATPTVRRLYGTAKGASPTLLVDAAKFNATLAASLRGRAFGAHLPQNWGLRERVVVLADDSPLLAAIESHVVDVAAGAAERGYCTSDICTGSANPEIRCDRCGAAFCSEDCKFAQAHACGE